MSNPLGSRYWKLWGASTVSNLADGLYQIALPLVALQYTRSPALVAGVAFAAHLPWLLFALHAGALADRLDRRMTMLVVGGLRLLAVGSFGVAVLVGVDSLWLLYGLALVMGVGETLFDTSAQSLLPMLVQREQLARANGRLYAAREIMNNFAGKAAGGALVGFAVAAAFLTPAALYGLAVVALLLLRGAYKPAHSGQSTLLQDIAEGIRYLRGHRLLLTLGGMVGAMNLANTAFFSVFAIFAVGADSPMGLHESAFGLLLTGTAAGAALGSLLVERIQGLIGRSRLLNTGLVAMTLFLATPAVTANVAAVAVAFFVGGMGAMMWNVVTVSLRQRIVPESLLGRVNSCYRLLAWGAMPLGAGLGGLVGELIGVRGVFVFAAGLTATLLLARRIVTDGAMDAAEAAADTDLRSAPE